MAKRKSSYELEREQNIRKNQAFFTEIFEDVNFASSCTPNTPDPVAVKRKRGRPRLDEQSRLTRKLTPTPKRPVAEPIRSSQRSQGAKVFCRRRDIQW